MTKAREQLEICLYKHTGMLTGAIILCGLILRLCRASSFYLNPDEALSYLVASQREFYQNAVRVAHPPLFILVLRGILRFGHSELALRLPLPVSDPLGCWRALSQRPASAAAAFAAGVPTVTSACTAKPVESTDPVQVAASKTSGNDPLGHCWPIR